MSGVPSFFKGVDSVSDSSLFNLNLLSGVPSFFNGIPFFLLLEVDFLFWKAFLLTLKRMSGLPSMLLPSNDRRLMLYRMSGVPFLVRRLRGGVPLVASSKLSMSSCVGSSG